MIKSFKHKGLQLFFETGAKSGIQAAHAKKLGRQLAVLNDAQTPQDMDVPGWRLHPLKGLDLRGHWAVTVNANWRMTFKFEFGNAILVDYQDYHWEQS